MRTVQPARVAVDTEAIDQRVRMHGVSWRAYEALLAWRGESARPRITYLEGELELMSPSRYHEKAKTRLGRLFETWCQETGVRAEGAGSWTIRRREVERGAEPDECYNLDPEVEDPVAPDIAIEVVWTRGGIDKLAVYRKLGVHEVWIWEDGKLQFHLLRGQRYVRAARSALLPKFDPSMLERHMKNPSQFDAVEAFQRELRAKRTRKRKR